MQRRIISVLSVLCVVLAFAFAVSTASPAVLAETTSSSATKKSNDEQPYEDPTTTKPTETSSKPTETSSKPTESSSKPTESSTESTSKPTETSSNPTNPTDPGSSASSTDPNHSTSSTDPNSSTSSTNKSDNTSTTKKKSSGKTTTRAYYPAPTQSRATVSKVDMPVVENTTQEGAEALNPMDAYFERISGNSTEFAQVETTTEPQQEEPQKKLSTAAIVAICLIGFAAVVVALTAVFAIRNKRANAQDTVSDDGGAYGTYDPDDDIYADPAPQPAPGTDDDAFTVVSLDDKNYKD